MTDAGATARPETSRVPQLLVLLVLVLAAFLQLTVVAKTEVDHPLRSDAGEYFSYAYNLHKYGVYSSARTWDGSPVSQAPTPDKVRSPGYPLFLLAAGSPEPTEAYLRRVSFLQAGMGILSVWLAYLIAARFLGRPWALAAAVLTALSPHLTMVSTYLLTESLFTLLLLASALATLLAVDSGRRPVFALAGLLWGLCSLVRPTAEFFPALLLLLVLVVPKLRGYLKPTALAFCCFLATLSPWVIRNLSVPPTAGPSLMVNSLAHGSYPGFMYEGRRESFGFPYRFDPEYPQHIRDLPTVLRHIGGRLVADPVDYGGWYLVGKPYFFLSLENVQAFDILIYPTRRTPFYDDARFAALRALGVWLHWPLMLSGLVGMLVLALRPRWLGLQASQATAAAIVTLLIAYAIALHMAVAPFPRYAIPFRPLIFALALLPLRAAWLAWGRRRLPR